MYTLACFALLLPLVACAIAYLGVAFYKKVRESQAEMDAMLVDVSEDLVEEGTSLPPGIDFQFAGKIPMPTSAEMSQISHDQAIASVELSMDKFAEPACVLCGDYNEHCHYSSEFSGWARQDARQKYQEYVNALDLDSLTKEQLESLDVRLRSKLQGDAGRYETERLARAYDLAKKTLDEDDRFLAETITEASQGPRPVDLGEVTEASVEEMADEYQRLDPKDLFKHAQAVVLASKSVFPEASFKMPAKRTAKKKRTTRKK